MNTTLWIVASLLAVVFAFSSIVKLSVPRDKLAQAPAGGWVEDVSAGAVRGIGALEVLVPLGLILPAVLDIAPVLVPVAAVGVMLLMIGAVITRMRSDHVATATIIPDLVYLALAAFLAWGRLGPEPL
jgi:hypothetical protein